MEDFWVSIDFHVGILNGLGEEPSTEGWKSSFGVLSPFPLLGAGYCEEVGSNCVAGLLLAFGMDWHCLNLLDGHVQGVLCLS